MLLLLLVTGIAVAALVVWAARSGRLGQSLDWEGLKEKARRWYEKASAFFLFQNFIGYLVACISAGHPVTFGEYASFMDHVLNRWRG